MSRTGHSSRAALVAAAGGASVAALVFASSSCSSFGGEDAEEGGVAPSQEAGIDAGPGEDGPVQTGDGGIEEDASDAGIVPVALCPLKACRLVFVTEERYNGAVGGVAGGDTKCMAAAAKSPHLAVKTRTFVAWLSTESSPAAGRIAHGGLPFRRLDGTVVANNWNDLIKPSGIANPINIDQYGILVPTPLVWTGTQVTGDVSANTCLGWTNGTSDLNGDVGRTDRTDGAWTDGDNNEQKCGVMARLYCIEN